MGTDTNPGPLYDCPSCGVNAGHSPGCLLVRIDKAEARIAELEAELADRDSRLAAVEDALTYPPEPSLSGHTPMDLLKHLSRQARTALSFVDGDFTCPGCAEKDGRLAGALAAWNLIRDIVPKAFPNAGEWCNHLDDILSKRKGGG
jgi:hypothetical protein